MNTITEYKVLRTDDPSRLENLVANAIENGWQPLGGVSVSDYTFNQAVVK